MFLKRGVETTCATTTGRTRGGVQVCLHLPDTGCNFDATWQAKEPTSKQKRFFQWQSNQWQRKAMMIKHELQAHICKFVWFQQRCSDWIVFLLITVPCAATAGKGWVGAIFEHWKPCKVYKVPLREGRDKPSGRKITQKDTNPGH